MTHFEDLINRLFAWIVEDPFYSQTFGTTLRVDDYYIVHATDSETRKEYYMTDLTEAKDNGKTMIKLLYTDWFKYNSKFSDFLAHCKAPNPDTI